MAFPVFEMYNKYNITTNTINTSTNNRLRSHQLVCLIDDVLMCWSHEEGCLKSRLVHVSTTQQQQQNNNNNNNNTFKTQTLALSRPPVWDVERVVKNKSGRCVALVGTRGVAVVYLPLRCGTPPLFDGGKDAITCKVDYIGEHFLTCHPKLEVVSAAWHPGSIDNTHLVTLFTDNRLRIYSLKSLDIPEQTIAVGPSEAGVMTNTSSLTYSSSLGQDAVAFDFGIPSDLVKFVSGRNTSSQSLSYINEDDEKRIRYIQLQWPIFILHSNGEVYFTNSSLGSNRPQTHKLQGPLKMTPPCEDNYGLDSCSLVVLQCCPPLLVIATSGGQLHHCVVVDDDGDGDGSDGDGGYNCDDSTDLADTLSSTFSLPTSVRLFVYETVELELSLIPDDQGFTTPLLLHQDHSSPARYIVSHEAGVYTVSVPLVEKLLQYNEMPEECSFSNSEMPCLVEHVLCTRLLTPTTVLPVVGLALSVSHALYILLASGKVYSITIPSATLPHLTLQQQQQQQQQQSTSCLLHSDLMPSPLRKVYSENFEDYIRGILQRTTSQPLLASGSTSQVTPSEYIHLLNRVMITLRSSYMQPQKVARLDMEKRSDILAEQKERLRCDIEELQAKKTSLTDKAHELAERYEDASEKKCLLIKRLECVMSRIMRTLPVLSSSEKKMMQELEAMKKHVPMFLNQLGQIKEKEKLTSQIETHNLSEGSRGQQINTSISETQLKTLSEALAKEGEKLVSLTEKVNQAKEGFHL